MSRYHKRPGATAKRLRKERAGAREEKRKAEKAEAYTEKLNTLTGYFMSQGLSLNMACASAIQALS